MHQDPTGLVAHNASRPKDLHAIVFLCLSFSVKSCLAWKPASRRDFFCSQSRSISRTRVTPGFRRHFTTSGPDSCSVGFLSLSLNLSCRPCSKLLQFIAPPLIYHTY